MVRKKKQTPADLALGKLPAEAPITRTVAKNSADAWPEIMETILHQARALLYKHVDKIKRAHQDAKEVESPQNKYRVSLTAVIDDENWEKYDIDVTIAYPSAMREAFSAKTKDSAKSLVEKSPDMVDQMDQE